MTDSESPRPLSVPEAISQRRATRSFDRSRAIPDLVLKEILHLATLAPSAFNLQPWRFLVVRTETNRKTLRACAFNQPKVTDASVMVILLGSLDPERSHLEPMLAEQLSRGSLTMEGAAEFRARARQAMDRVAERPLWATRSTMLAAASLMLAAESLGVASAPMEGFDHAKVKEAFGIPNDHVVCSLIALGYRLESKPFPGRFGLTEVCYEEHFGQPWSLGDHP